MKKWDVIIIGSGISSLTCAAILAKKGKSVAVLEQHTKPGGYLHCFRRFGHQFDTGSHCIGAMDKGQPFHTILSYIGVYDDDLFVPLQSDGFDVMHFPSFEVRLPKGYVAANEALSEKFPTERKNIQAYFDRVRTSAARFQTYEFNEKADPMGVLRDLETSLKEVVTGLTTNTQLQCVFYSYCCLHGVNPEDVAFGFHALMTDSFIHLCFNESRRHSVDPNISCPHLIAQGFSHRNEPCLTRRIVYLPSISHLT